MPARNELNSIVFMKVGTHANETFEDIVKRKQQEYKKSGRIFWGYGGGTMHPISKVQPFARYHIQHGNSITLVMQGIVSNHWEEAVATEYSEDGVNWQPIPDGIEVRGSRYALVLDEIQEGDLSVDLSEYRVGFGPSEGRLAPSYIQGRVDKGLLVHTGRPNEEVAQKVIRSNYSANVKEPFAVLLRSDPKA